MFRDVRPLFFVLPLLIAGCGDEASDDPFDPRGDDVALYGEWDVDGEDPAIVDACAEANFETVELVLYRADESESYTDASFRWPCDYGVYDSVTPVLRHGWYAYQWRIYEPSATEPALVSKVYGMDVRDATSFDLQAVDFRSSGDGP
jgi:hypothetical protein